MTASNPQYPVVVTGRQTFEAARKKIQKARDVFPYVWDYAPPGSQAIFEKASIVAPAPTTPTLVCFHRVAVGMRFVLTHILLNADVGNAWVPGSGVITFFISVNQPGTGNAQGYPLNGYASIITPLGSFACGPWPVPRTDMFTFKSLDTIRITVETTAAINQGAPNYIHGQLIGYEFPAEE